MPAARFMVSRSLVHACILAQLLSFLLALTGITSGILAANGFNAPTTQSFFNYCLLTLTSGGVHLWKTGGKFKLQNPWYSYAALAVLDVEGNYLLVKAYQYTSITSVTLLDSMTIPGVMLLSWLVFRARFQAGHFLGALLCTTGLAVLVLTDGTSSTGGSNPLLGDALVVAGAAVYAISNVAQEKLLGEATSRWELLGTVGLFGCCLSGVQALVLERGGWREVQWSGVLVAALVGFSLALYLFSLLVPNVLLWGSATVLNLSLLTSDLWAAGARELMFGGFGGTGWAFALALLVETAGIALYAFCGSTHTHADGGEKVAAITKGAAQQAGKGTGEEDEEAGDTTALLPLPSFGGASSVSTPRHPLEGTYDAHAVWLGGCPSRGHSVGSAAGQTLGHSLMASPPSVELSRTP
mmetsp:Transcript_26949/g.58883  ORF Transcript_26949/g.58883 Transcript_26949/m.58883 type:complete len:411 (+) Transcript_26949:91-1323(+)